MWDRGIETPPPVPPERRETEGVGPNPPRSEGDIRKWRGSKKVSTSSLRKKIKNLIIEKLSTNKSIIGILHRKDLAFFIILSACKREKDET